MKLIRVELYTFFNLCTLIWYFCTVPIEAPTNVHLEIQSSGSIFLTWQPPPLSYQNGIISGYTILLTALQDGSSHVYNLPGAASSHHFEGVFILLVFEYLKRKLLVSTWIVGLPGFVEYEVAVAAQTAVGTGPYSNVTNFTTPEGGKESLQPSLDVFYQINIPLLYSHVIYFFHSFSTWCSCWRHISDCDKYYSST